MIYYRLGRILQILALIDCAFALFFVGLFPAFSGMEAQLQIVLFAGALFAAGRVFQKMGESRLQAAGAASGAQDSGDDVSVSSPESPQGGSHEIENR